LLGHFDEADAQFNSVVALHNQIGKPIWTARSKLGSARMLRQRGTRGDNERARELATDALVSADRLGAATASGAHELLTEL
jgi:hypothetical protein